MITLLAAIFFSLFIYGLVIGKAAIGGFSLIMSVFMLWADRFMTRRYAVQEATMPAHAVQPPETTCALAKHECECIASRF
jgi:hypothetical protein